MLTKDDKNRIRKWVEKAEQQSPPHRQHIGKWKLYQEIKEVFEK